MGLWTRLQKLEALLAFVVSGNETWDPGLRDSYTPGKHPSPALTLWNFSDPSFRPVRRPPLCTSITGASRASLTTEERVNLPGPALRVSDV